MSEPLVFAMSVTPFTPTGKLDEAALRAHLQRMADNGAGVYLASPGTGEGHSLSPHELRRVYEIGVEVCAGRVPVHANPPEGRTAQEVLERVKIAEAAGVDVIQIYTVDGGHGMRPTVAEQVRYYRDILDNVSVPMALSVNLLAGGYVNPLEVFTTLVADYPQISYINVNHGPTSFLAGLIAAIGPRVRFCTSAQMLGEGLALGVDGCLTGEVNILPQTIRAIGRSFMAGDWESYHKAMQGLFGMNAVVRDFRFPPGSPTNARWVKATMAALGLPGNSGGYMRPPYLPSTDEELAALSDALAPLDLLGLEAEASTWATVTEGAGT